MDPTTPDIVGLFVVVRAEIFCLVVLGVCGVTLGLFGREAGVARQRALVQARIDGRGEIVHWVFEGQVGVCLNLICGARANSGPLWCGHICALTRNGTAAFLPRTRSVQLVRRRRAAATVKELGAGAFKKRFSIRIGSTDCHPLVVTGTTTGFIPEFGCAFVIISEIVRVPRMHVCACEEGQ